MQDHEARRGKIKLSIGNLSFSGEGDQDWLAHQISKLIGIAPQVQIATSEGGVPPKSEPKQNEPMFTESLASYLREKGGDMVQVQRFLATAAWLQRRGEKDLTTREVSKALKDNQQKRLGNPADCLNQNVGRGFCEKTPGGFHITREGWRQLGESKD